MDMKETIERIVDHRLADDIDVSFADLMSRLSGKAAGNEFFLAVLLLSHIVTRHQHICLDLAGWAGRRLAGFFFDQDLPDPALLADCRTPNLDEWMERLSESPAVGAPGEYRPLILDEPGKRLYLYRYWDYEYKLAENLRHRAAVVRQDLDSGRLREGLARLFDESEEPSPDWQKVAVFAAVTRLFCVITGGPGTGKTHTVSAVICLLHEQWPDMAIALAAPTGKAAARLQKSLGGPAAGGGGEAPPP